MKVPFHEFIEIKDNKIPVWIQVQTRMQADTGFKMHWHEAIEFYFVLSGGTEVYCNGQREWLYEGDTGYIGWCEVHQGLDFLDHTEFLTVQIDMSVLEEHQDIENPLIDADKYIPTFIKQDAQLQALAMTLKELHRREDEASAYMIKGVIYQLIGYLLALKHEHLQHRNNHSSSEKVVRGVIKHINYHYAEKITLSSLSHQIGMTPQHLSKLFKQHTGFTVHQYLNKYRCYRALNLIMNGMEFMAAAFEVGYSDYNYFSKVFKTIFEQSPRHYMKKLKNIDC